MAPIFPIILPSAHHQTGFLAEAMTRLTALYDARRAWLQAFLPGHPWRVDVWRIDPELKITWTKLDGVVWC